MSLNHIPVMLEEVISHLDLKTGATVIDGTVGLGGHAKALLEQVSSNGKLLGIDKDRANLKRAKSNLMDYKKQVELVHDSYLNIKQIAYDRGFYPADAILLDLGFSSVHIEDGDRGFSFQHEGPLDMRYDQSQELTANEIIKTWSAKDLETIFRKYGEERDAHKIAIAIVLERKNLGEVIPTTTLVEIILRATSQKGKKHKSIHPATRVFQALRIAVNNELEELAETLPHALGTLKPGGRLAVISFHSMEDRIVKQTFKQFDGTKIKIITKKPIRPSVAEIAANPRSRSAKLRIAERLCLASKEQKP